MTPKANSKGILGRWDATSEEIRQAMGEAIFTVLGEHKRAGVPAATIRNGKVVMVPPEEIEIPDGFKDEPTQESGEKA